MRLMGKYKYPLRAYAKGTEKEKMNPKIYTNL